jgi:hypothetical protein
LDTQLDYGLIWSDTMKLKLTLLILGASLPFAAAHAQDPAAADKARDAFMKVDTNPTAPRPRGMEGRRTTRAGLHDDRRQQGRQGHA